jgi:hypothetical protein
MKEAETKQKQRKSARLGQISAKKNFGFDSHSNSTGQIKV